ncbi:MAG: hypothetical protein JXB25_12670, partial [Deltaproteobacteria bacterium]|nr:hypothetical protein [Deltaproteobacteria bacterium]
RRLAAEGWVTRDYQPTVPPKVTCALTEKVLELDGAMIELDRNLAAQFGKAGRWGAGHAAGPGRRLIETLDPG